MRFARLDVNCAIGEPKRDVVGHGEYWSSHGPSMVGVPRTGKRESVALVVYSRGKIATFPMLPERC